MKTQFTPIAMRCTQEQFEAIKPKLKKAGLIDDDINSWDNEFCYLVNKRRSADSGVNLYSNLYGYVIYGTWNESTFLKACGIDVTPSLEDVKKHFENAKEVKDCTGRIIDLTNTKDFDERGIHLWEKEYWICHNETMNSLLWNRTKKQYAEIISYKDTYTVDKEFIKEAYDNPELLKEKFPSVFESDIIPQENKWYWMNCNAVEDDYLVLSNGKGLEGKAWIINGSYIDVVGTFNSVKRLATDKEVEEGLINEAKRRGFKEGNYKCLDKPKLTRKNCNTYQYDASDNKLLLVSESFYCNRIFKDGIWAEILSEPIELTMEQIAEKFNVDVNLLKIKK